MNNRYSVLIVEDEKNIITFIKAILTANEYDVLIAQNGEQALMMARSHSPDIIILDLGLPDMDGLRVIKAVREWSQVPIIVVSARSREQDKVVALDLGADDYVTKPFGTSELLARVRTAVRHIISRSANAEALPTGEFRAGELLIDYKKRRVFLGDQDVHLTKVEYKIVALLAEYAGRVLTYDYLIKNIWGQSESYNNQILRVNMANIRRKIEEDPTDPKYIFTEMGVGYRMVEAESVE